MEQALLCACFLDGISEYTIECGGKRFWDTHQEERLENMADEFLRKKAKLRAMHLLEHMDRTEKQLWDKLRQSYPEDIAAEAMEYVKSFGYIDDSRYARNYISSRLHTKSRQVIMQELGQKGVDREKAQDAWEEVSETEEADEKEILRKLALKKYAPGSRLDEGEMRRLQGFLGRKGFSWEDIRSVLAEEDICIERGE